YEEACREVGKESALLVLDPPDSTSSQLVLQGFRSYCGIPAAAVSTNEELDLASLAREWHAEGRQLVVVAADVEILAAAGSQIEGVLFPSRYPILEYTLMRRPRELVYMDASMVFGRLLDEGIDG